MNLLVRINLALALAITLAAPAVGWACSAMLQENAKQEALREAGLMVDSALAMRAYTATEIIPLLSQLHSLARALAHHVGPVGSIGCGGARPGSPAGNNS